MTGGSMRKRAAATGGYGGKRGMKIGFLIGNMSHAGGTERVLQQIANGLAERGHQVVVISVWGKDELVFPLDGRITFRRLGDDYPSTVVQHLRTVSRLRKAVREEALPVLVDVDLILTLYSLPATAGLAGVKRIAWEHFNFYYHFPKNNRLRRVAMRLAARFSHVVLVLTQEDRAYYEENLNIRGRLCQIYNPNPFEDAAREGGGERLVLAAGRLTRAKGFDLLLESWAEVEAEFPDWTLRIVGEGEERQALEAQRETLGLRRVELPGQAADMGALYRQAGIFALSSRDEGFGMVLIEAMAYGRPVVSFACKAGPRDIVTDGENGLLFPVGDCAGFAQGLRRLMGSEQLRQELGERARLSVDRFSLRTVLDQWETLLNAL